MTNAADEFDPINKLMKARDSLRQAGARGEPVQPQLQEIENSIREIWEQRGDRPRERERYR